ncbi:MAG: hypothetical protein Q9M43_01290 [Sulfurimonas sp.]|nr:hypothetical protein [Sulfurimonas sp.]
MKIFIVSLLTLFVVTLQASEQNFNESYNANVYGNVKMIGNTMLEPDTSKDVNDNNFFLSDDGTAYGRNISNGQVQDIWNGSSWVDVSSYDANNFTYLKYININNDANVSIYNSSSSTLTLPAGSKVVFARRLLGGNDS